MFYGLTFKTYSVIHCLFNSPSSSVTLNEFLFFTVLMVVSVITTQLNSVLAPGQVSV